MDQFKQISTFVEIAAKGSLSAAARAEGIAPAMIGRRLDALEERLGVKLLQRTTRKIALTNEGEAFLEDCQRILSDLEDAESAVSERSAHASGHLLISAPAGFGRQHVAPLMPSFLTEHRDVTLTLNLNDRVVDLIGEGVDVAIRIASLSDSTLIGTKLADNKRVVVASPAYIKRHGKPQSLDDLAKHNCLAMSGDGSQRGWVFRQNGKVVTMKVAGNLFCNDGQVLHDWAISGKGLAWRSMWEVGTEIESGQLVTVMDEFAAPGNDIYAVFAQRRHLPLRIRAFVDFLRHAYAQADYWRKG
ncbi:LysR family transcriptional regulator [Glaciimonas sp. CA11.2]|uniref:LysR family transcriptional regulator n=1 Tax=unclassified Glaciimonas TaxID=2644401 RepID=UPI002AB4EF29|nr:MULTISPECIES: LysR family transcriptional regulator [unclassified Glaciimonas]MDY7547971.1 LysR family transcriptional regulator [Glaciimonas sp. CA11.2]MEB0010143.1 LysR family transcriptional regulator [Glaciimonas sp. Cout2]MEB0084182.1 LysR family transcriptional regulator [Glaciimonas sp. Gout2]MEB0164632.1 LysR family transcriptional regulator [Glaciimonas sp. CA11.2]